MLENENEQNELRALVRDSFERRRHAVVFDLARKLRLRLDENDLGSSSHNSPEREWIKIESLSQLRAQVGGRFKNIKEKWINAGFPLREHRGDRAHKAAVDYDAWVQMANWILRQGYEARLATEQESWLMEIREIKSGNSSKKEKAEKNTAK